MHLPFWSASSQPDLEIIIPGRPERLLRQAWHSFQGFSRRHQAQIVAIIILGLAAISITFAFTLLINSNLVASIMPPAHETNEITPPAEVANPPEQPTTPSKAPFINLQPTVDRWVKNVNAKVGL